MIISDLNHLEVVTEASSVVGGKKGHGKNGQNKDLKVNKNFVANNQANVSIINQVQIVTAIAIAPKGGNATAIAAGGNQTAGVTQTNEASLAS